MRQSIFYSFTFLVMFISCSNNSKISPAYSLKDAVIKQHFQELDSSERFDTTDINYKILKAYVSDDTVFLKHLLIDMDYGKRERRERELTESCIQQTKLRDLKADEAYRFIYSGAFCNDEQITTVSKTGDSINLNFALFQVKRDTADCRKIIEFDKKITLANWNEIKQQIENADFWGLKSENGAHGLDGSSLTVIGIKKGDPNFQNEPKYNYVYRWGNSTLRESFHLITKISGNRQGCFWIE